MLSGMSKSLVRPMIGVAVFAALLALTSVLPVAASAKGAKGAEKIALQNAEKCHGKVTAVDAKAGTITIHNKKDGDMTLTVGSTARIKVNKAPGTLADVKIGMAVMVRTSDKKAALAINAHDPKSKGAAEPLL